MGKTVEEMRKYKREWAKQKCAKDPDFVEKCRIRKNTYNKKRRGGLDAYEKFNISGNKYGKLTVICKSDDKRRKGNNWICNCDCGTKGIVRAKADLKNGDSTHCGCVKRTNSITHGYTINNERGSEYKTWSSMKTRCYNNKSKNYIDYGERGIIVCERWINSFINFLKDMGTKPTPKHSLERIDNDGNYELSNCCWATKEEQSNNRRNVVKIKYNGATNSMKQWSKILGIKYHSLFYYLREKKITIEEVVLRNGTIFANK